MSRLPIPHIINTIKTKLGFDRTMTAPGDDVVDAVNKQSQQIASIRETNTEIPASTISDLETALNTLLAKMTDHEIRAIRIASSITTNGFKSGVTYSGYITRLSSGWGSCSLVDHVADNMFIGISGGTYYYNSVTQQIADVKDLWANSNTFARDLNTLNIGESSIIYAETPNRPQEISYGFCVCFGSGQYKFQVAYDITNASNLCRRIWNNSAWASWVNIN